MTRRGGPLTPKVPACIFGVTHKHKELAKHKIDTLNAKTIKKQLEDFHFIKKGATTGNAMLNQGITSYCLRVPGHQQLCWSKKKMVPPMLIVKKLNVVTVKVPAPPRIDCPLDAL